MINAVPLGLGNLDSMIPQPCSLMELTLFAVLAFDIPEKPGIPSWATIPAASDKKITHWMCLRKKCVSKNTVNSIKTAYFGFSSATMVAVTVRALTRAGFPSSGAISDLNALNVFSLIFFFIFRILLYFK